MPSLLLKNARLFGQPEARACFIQDGIIVSFSDAAGGAAADKTLDCGGALVLPALQDCVSFFNNDLESLETTAAAGGFAEVWTLLPDNRLNKLRGEYVIPALTSFDEQGTEVLADLGLAAADGRNNFSNGNCPITDNHLMKQAMTYVADLGGILWHQPQDSSLAIGGVMNEGAVAAALGLKGIPAEAEVLMLARDIELVRMTGCSYFAQQLSTARGVEMVRAAKAEGLPIHCGVSINHLLLTEDAIGEFRTFSKLTPPLRTEDDRQALLEGVRDGTINYIVSAHNPQSQEGKRLPFEFAESGSIGLETFLAAIFLLKEKEGIALETLLEKIIARAWRPSGGKLREGVVADLVCFDENAPWQLDVAASPLPGKTQNSALDGHHFTGKIKFAIIKGEVKHNARPD